MCVCVLHMWCMCVWLIYIPPRLINCTGLLMQQITGIPPEGLAAEEIEKMRKKFGVNYKFSKFVLNDVSDNCRVCACICICMYVCVCVCMCVYMCVCCVCMHVCVCMYVYVCMYVCTYVHICTYMLEDITCTLPSPPNFF